MVGVKGKSSTIITGFDDGGTRKSVGLKNFKVYAENEEEKVHSRSSVNPQRKVSLRAPACNSEVASSTSAMALDNPLRKSSSLCKGISPTPGDPRELEKSKGSRDIFIGTSGRKALVGVSNLLGNILKTKVHDGSKPLPSKDSISRSRSSLSSNCVKVAGGIWADKAVGKLVLGFGVMWWSVATILTPVAIKLGLPFLL